ncbi:MAG: flavodoxin family protein [Clostridiaceae bacterium]
MKRVVISEYGEFDVPNEYQLDLSKIEVKDCTGCWSCWLKTPGRCINKDLDAFYKAYLHADKVIIFSKISQGFVSGNLKSLFDRMLPLFLPFITYETGESMHVGRYGKYPEIEVYYQGDFMTKADQDIYENYMHRAFYQFRSKCEIVKPIAQFSLEKI